MKKFLTNNRETILEFFLFSFFVCLLFLYLNLKGLTIGNMDTSSDFFRQHIRFIDYIRNNFWETKDFFPQLTMNFGGGQNAANFYYYGFYNPLITLSFLFPFIDTLKWMQVIAIILITTTFLAMNILLKRFEVKREITLSVSILIAFCPTLIYHTSFHVMFTYFFPVMIFSLIALDILIKNKIKWPFILCIALIFFTNFFFSLIIGFIQLIFFIVLLHWKYNLSKKEAVYQYRSLFFAYSVGILIGMIVFLPQIVSTITSSRSENSTVELSLLFPAGISMLAFDRYSASLGIIGISTLLMGLTNYRKKMTFILTAAVLFTLTFMPFNYLLNIFQYVHNKIFIYLVPIIFFLFALLINDKKIKYKKSSLLASVVIVFVMLVFPVKFKVYLNDIDRVKFVLMLLSQIVFVQLLITEKIRFRKLLLSAMTLVTVFSTINYAAMFEPKDFYRNTMLLSNYGDRHDSEKEEDLFYRTNYPMNYVSSMNKSSPLVYTSIENKEYFNFYNNFVKLENSTIERYTPPSGLASEIISNFLGIKKYYGNHNTILNYENARPFIYGVEKENSYNIKSLENLEPFDRILALNQGFFTKDEITNFDYKKPKLSNFYTSKKNLQFKQKEALHIKVPTHKEKQGTYIIEINVISDQIDTKPIWVNDHYVIVKAENFYKEPEVRKAMFYIDSTEANGDLLIKFDGSNNIYDKVKVSFLSKNQIDETNMNYIKTSNNDIVYNHSYSFNLQLENDGYLGTSIFYDDGFIIKDNGKVINKEKVNHSFLGAKLSKGSHDIKIEYVMPGFKIGALLTAFGLVIFLLVMVIELKLIKKIKHLLQTFHRK